MSAFYMVALVLVYILGSYLPWRTLAACCSVFPVLSMVLLCFIPESPAWLVTQGRHTILRQKLLHDTLNFAHCTMVISLRLETAGRLIEARRSLQWLRGPNWDITEEFNRLEKSWHVTQARSKPTWNQGAKTNF